MEGGVWGFGLINRYRYLRAGLGDSVTTCLSLTSRYISLRPPLYCVGTHGRTSLPLPHINYIRH
jgi:hypothetical protein